HELLLFDRNGLPKPEDVAKLRFEVRESRPVFQEPLLGVLASLPDALALVGVPGPGLLDEAVIDASVQHAARLRDAFTVEHVELRLPEGRRELVLDPLDLGPDAQRLGALLDGVLAADVEPYGGVELQRAPAGRRLGVAEHHADLLSDLVDEN